MAKYKFWVVLGVMLFLFISLVNGKSFSLDPCAGQTTIIEDATNYYMGSGCFDVIFPKTYDTTPISFYDSYNEDVFDLKLFSLTDVNVANENQKQTVSLQDIGMTASVVDDTVIYTSPDGKTRLFYSIMNNKIKAGLEVDDWSSNYASGKLKLRTRVHKENTASSHFINLPAVVDGVEQSLITESEYLGVNEFIVQTLYIGSSFNSLVIDPIYAVDYSPEPAEYLINGSLTTDPNSAFEYSPDITTNMSDNLTNTFVETFPQILENVDGILAFKFEETTGTFVPNLFGYANHLTLTGSPNLNVDGNNGSGVYFDGTNYGTSPSDTSFNAGTTEDMMVCLSLNMTTPIADQYAFDRSLGDDFYFKIKNTGLLEAKIKRGGAGSDAKVTSSSSVANGVWHRLCFYQNISSGASELWVDGVSDGTDASTPSEDYVATSAFTIGSQDDFTNGFEGYIDELCYWNGVGLDATAIVSGYESDGCGSVFTSANGISAMWNQTYQNDSTHFLGLYKTTTGTQTIRVNSMDDVDNVSQSLFTTQALAGTGWFYVDVDSFLSYQTDTLGLSFVALRAWSLEPMNISEVVLRTELNDTIPPVITDCSVNDSTIVIGESVRFQCNVTDNIAVDSVNATVNEVTILLLQDGDFWWFGIECSAFTIGEYEWKTTSAKDILGLSSSVNVSINVTCSANPQITLLDYYAVNSSNGRIDTFSTNYLEEIEKVILNYSVSGNEAIDSWYFNFTADGYNPCSLGNKQSSTCYFENTWIQYILGEVTATFDDTASPIGDRIIADVSGNSTDKIITLTVDEHYNPNVFKWYDAGYNFSDVKWQNDSLVRIKKDQFNRIELNQSLIPLDADQYKLDMRLVHNNPNNVIEAYLCNSSYTTGKPHDVASCQIVVEKNYYDLQDDGTKFRGIFTKNLIDELGDIKYIILELHDTDPTKYFALKTYKATTPSYTTHWEYGNGSSWTNSGDGYETEANINWFYDGAEPTEFSFRFFSNTSSSDYNFLESNITWIINATNNYPPIPNIFEPLNGEIIVFPYNITFSALDVNDDPLVGSIKLYQSGILNDTLTTTLNQDSGFFLWNDNTPPNNYSLVLEMCETNTSQMYCANFSVGVEVICGENWLPQLDSCLINDTQLKYYTDNNSCGTVAFLPVDNGTYVSCNYCSEDLVQSNSTCYLSSGIYVKDITYTDSNYFSCCAVTGIASDCSVDVTAPFNETTTVNCTVVLEDDFDISLDLELLFGFGFGGLASDKVSGKIFINNTNESYYCLSYVESFDRNLVQTNPPYTKRVVGLLQLMGKEIEDREYFVTQNGLANIYWTNNNLVVDGRQYIFGVQCAGEGNSLKSEVLAQVGYKPINAPITRWFWFTDNILGIMLFLFIILIVVLGIGFYWKRFKS